MLKIRVFQLFFCMQGCPKTAPLKKPDNRQEVRFQIVTAVHSQDDKY